MNMQERIENLEKELSYLKAIVCTPATLGVVKPWEPEGGSCYITAYGTVDTGCSFSVRREFGTERPTKELAERAAVLMRRFNRLLAYHDEFCPEHDPAGKWDGTNNYTVYLDSTNTWEVDVRSWRMLIGVYFPQGIAEGLCRKLNSGEVAL